MKSLPVGERSADGKLLSVSGQVMNRASLLRPDDVSSGSIFSSFRRRRTGHPPEIRDSRIPDRYRTTTSLIEMWKTQSSSVAAWRLISIRGRKISKYSITGAISVSIVN